jgi:hypothetical protein
MRFVAGFAGCLVSICALADRHQGADTNEDVLTAIKERLVAEAQTANTQVTNTAWLDSDGRLHESTMIRSDVRVRGVQVRRYLEEMRRPEVEITLDEKPGALPKCFASDDHLIRTVKVHPPIKSGQFDVNHAGIVTQLGALFHTELNQGFEYSPFWHTVGQSQGASGYLQMVSGVVPETSRYDMRIAMSRGYPPQAHQSEQIPGSDPISTFFNGSPSWFEESWVRIHLSLSDTADGALVWQARTNLRIPAREVSYTEAALPRDVNTEINRLLSKWITELSNYARCEPIHFALMQPINDQMQIDGGASSGIRVGDQLLIIDRNTIPQRSLEPGALAQLSLVQVTQTFENHATIERIAGASLQQIGGRVALPF